jgi:hypothetical protein
MAMLPCSDLFGRLRVWLVVCMLLQLAAPGIAAATAWTTSGADGATQVHLYFFWSQRCPHCLEARPHAEALAGRHSWIVLHSLELSRSPENV